ncbi:MAG: GNAT family N-acetyltransferase [Thermomicrobiales bacterium]
MPAKLCRKNEPESSAPCDLLVWDSAFWGFPVAQVRGNHLTMELAEAIDYWCAAHQVACLYFLATSDDPGTVRSAEDAAFRLVDTRISGVITAERFSLLVPVVPRPALAIRHATPDDLPTLQRLAAASFLTTRFYFDENFPRARCGELYAQWVADSVRRASDVVLVAEGPEGLTGYVSIQHSPDAPRAQFGLLNVTPGARRQGIAQELMRDGLAWCTARGIHEVVGVTQGRNIAVQAFNCRVGFITESCQLWYHKWYWLPGKRATNQ